MQSLLRTQKAVILLAILLLRLSPTHQITPPPNASPGDRIGLRLISTSPFLPSGKAPEQFWVVAPVSGDGLEHFKEVSSNIWYKGEWSLAETKVFTSIVSRHCDKSAPDHNYDTVDVLDIGAHVGWYSLIALAHGCKVAAVEVNPYFLSLLRMSAELNDFTESLTVWDRLVGADDAEYALFNGKSGDLEWDSERGSTVTRHRTITLDKLGAKNEASGKRVLFMKLDVEGLELQSLNTGREKLMNNLHHFMVEVSIRHPHHANNQVLVSNSITTLVLLSFTHGFTLYLNNDAGLIPISPTDEVSRTEGDYTKYWTDYIAGVERSCAQQDSERGGYCQLDVFGCNDKFGEMPQELIYGGQVEDVKEKETALMNWPPRFTDSTKSQIAFGFAVDTDAAESSGDKYKLWEFVIRSNAAAVEEFAENCQSSKVRAPASDCYDVADVLMGMIETEK